MLVARSCENIFRSSATGLPSGCRVVLRLQGVPLAGLDKEHGSRFVYVASRIHFLASGSMLALTET